MPFANFQKVFVVLLEQGIQKSISQSQQQLNSNDSTLQQQASKELQSLTLTLDNVKTCAARFTIMVKDFAVKENLQKSGKPDKECDLSSVLWEATSVVYGLGKKI